MNLNKLIFIIVLLVSMPALAQTNGFTNGWPALPPIAAPESKAINSIYLQLGSAYSENLTADQGGIGYGVSLSRNFSLVFDTHFTRFSQFTFTYWEPNRVLEKQTAGLSIWTFLGNAKVNITDRDNPVVLYGIAGLGGALLFSGAAQDNSQSFPANSELCPTIRLGFGIDVRLGKGTALTFEENFVSSSYGSLFQGQGEGFASYGLSSLGAKLDI